MNIERQNAFLEVLKNGVKPALGCTEPVAVGLAVARAYRELDKGKIEEINVRVSPNIYKNGMGVGIPGTEEIGLLFAASLGAVVGDSDLGLEVYKNVNSQAEKEAEALLEDGKVKVELEENQGKFFIGAEVVTDKGRGYTEIRQSHTNITLVKKDEEIILEKEVEKVETSKTDSNFNLKDIEISEIREFADSVDFEKIKFLLDGADMNLAIAEYGLENKSGLGLGAALDQLIKEGLMSDDLISRARVLSSAASDARMSGVNMPVMSSGGSGNQGITTIIAPTLVCKEMGCDDEKLARTLAYAHILSSFIKQYTGGIAPVCGCGIAAGMGASGSIVYALGGSDEQVGTAIKNMVGTLTGMVCDGAKGGCAFKISTAASEAIIQAKLAMAGVEINNNDGIVHPDTKQTIINLGDFSNRALKDADMEIIDIMMR